MIIPTISVITGRTYNVPVTPHDLVLRANHECLRLERVEWRRTRYRQFLARICQDIRDDSGAEWSAALSNDSDGSWLEGYDSYS